MALVINQPTTLGDQVKIVVCVSSVKMASASASVDSKAELTALLEQWEREQQGSTQELVNILTKSVLPPEYKATIPWRHIFWLTICGGKTLTFRISELVEKETEEYHKADPDPFDDRHPGIQKKRCQGVKIWQMLTFYFLAC